ncbi:MAG: alcohol dehydrogenase catalytic domain-containing protein [Proteobacteria bacterium]|nr:alcohol dehydrogenase catalytic domain-containing protein [Pseudomonadota bacterium]
MPKIVRFHELGDANVLKLEDVSPSEPGPGEVRVRVAALGLNRAEVMFRQGRYIEKPDLPSLLGYEASGVVDAIGEGVSELRVGERVSTIPSFSMRQYGVYGEMAVVPAHAAVRYPSKLSPVEGAAIWMQYLTPYFALYDLGHTRPGQHVLITAASRSLFARRASRGTGQSRLDSIQPGPEGHPRFIEENATHRPVLRADANVPAAKMRTKTIQKRRNAFTTSFFGTLQLTNTVCRATLRALHPDCLRSRDKAGSRSTRTHAALPEPLRDTVRTATAGRESEQECPIAAHLSTGVADRVSRIQLPRQVMTPSHWSR